MAKTPTVDERIAAGMKLLDKHFKSKSWRKKIDRSKIDMKQGSFDPHSDLVRRHCGCVLAQLDPDGQFNGVLHEKLFGSKYGQLNEDELHGFIPVRNGWATLTKKWKAALKNA